jgi:long-chain acyl-CoA synthetase
MPSLPPSIANSILPNFIQLLKGVCATGSNVSKWAEDRKLPFTTFVDLSQKAEIAELVQKDIKGVNRVLPEPSRVKKYVLLHKEFDPDEAELTRTRKLRRRFFKERYQELINAIYADKEKVEVKAAVKYRDGRTGTISTALRIRSVSGEDE